jgi:hypothetical protein
MIVLDLSILNQKGTPMFNSDLTANRPAAGIVGRIFIAIDSPYGIFRDTGTAWDQISSAGGADTNIYNTDGTLTGTRTVSSGGFQLVFNPQTTFFSSLIPSTTASSFSVLGSNTLTFAAGFSSSNIGNVYSANGAINAQIFSGDATFAQANLASAMVNVNKIDFSSGGHTITMTQSTAPGIRAMTGTQNQIQFTGSHNGRITHAAVSQNLGFFRDTGSTSTLTITNAYSHLINPLDDYGAGFTFTNRWGIYQAGASDKNYFAANSLFGTTVDNGYKVQINGTFIASNGSGQLEFRSNGYSYITRIYVLGNEIYNSTGGAALGVGSRMFMESNTGIDFSWFNLVQGSFLFKTTCNTNNSVGGTKSSFIIQHNINDGSASSMGTFESMVIADNLNMTAFPVATYKALVINPNIAAGGTNIVAIQTVRGNVLIGTTSGGLGIGVSAINASARLQVDSTTQGFLPPRMTNAERTAIATPAIGLIVYCTDAVEGLYVYKSTGWTFVI